MEEAFVWLEGHGGIELLSDYPYAGVDQTCAFSAKKAVAQITGYQNMSSNETELAAQLAATGPLSAAVDANMFW